VAVSKREARGSAPVGGTVGRATCGCDYCCFAADESAFGAEAA
jgi:hypothetical protein